VDKYEYAAGSSGNWLNLARLMSDNDEAKALREAVVLKKKATFVVGLPRYVKKIPFKKNYRIF
jgi:hypothetical protein